MQLTARSSHQNPSFINHTPRAFEIAAQDALEPRSRSQSQACTQASHASPDFSPFNSFERYSPYNSASFGHRSAPTYDCCSELDNRTHPSSSSTGYGQGSDSFQQPTAPSLSLSLTNIGDTIQVTSPVLPFPYSWPSGDSSDFECAVAGEYSPYAPEFSEQLGRMAASRPERRLSDGAKLNLLTMKALPVLPLHQPHQAILPANNQSFDIAYFLKNTGPPSQREAGPTALEDGVMGRRKRNHKNPLRFLRVGSRKSLATRVGGVECIPDADKNALPISFKPPDRVIQKISKDGKKYLQIIADEKTTTTQQVEIPKRILSNNENRKQRVSITFSERTETVSTDELDIWLSTFSLQKQGEEELQSEKGKGKSIKLVEEEEHRVTRKGKDELLGEKRENSKEGCDQKALKSSYMPFCLNPVEEPKIAATYSEAPDAMAALFSNPPSTRQSTADAVDSFSNAREAKADSDNYSLPGSPQPPQSEESGSSFERGKERLVGQGMRRPYPEQGKSATCHSDSLSADSTSGGSYNREDSGVGKMPYADPNVFGLGAKDSTRKSREERIRARKLRDLQRTRNIIGKVLERHVDGLMAPELVIETPPVVMSPENNQAELGHLKEMRLQSQFEPQPQDDSNTRHLSVDSLLTTPAPDYSTSYTPVSGRMSLTPIMLVAEQIPMSESKAVKKPARLVLRERPTPKTLAVAVRKAAESAAESASVTSSGVESEIKERDMSTSFSDVGTLACGSRAEHEHKIIEGMVPSRVLSLNSEQTTELEKAMERQGGAKHLSAPAAIPTALPSTSSPVYSASIAQKPASIEGATSTPATTSGAARHKHTSSHASHASIASSLLSSSSVTKSREARLEVRVETLERENRLLEAALMAALKSGGRLNKCPCRVRYGGGSAVVI